MVKPHFALLEFFLGTSARVFFLSTPHLITYPFYFGPVKVVKSIILGLGSGPMPRDPSRLQFCRKTRTSAVVVLSRRAKDGNEQLRCMIYYSGGSFKWYDGFRQVLIQLCAYHTFQKQASDQICSMFTKKLPVFIKVKLQDNYDFDIIARNQ